MNTLIYLALAAIIAYGSKKLTEKVGVPTVTGYVITGVLLGSSLFGLFKVQVLDHLDIVNDFALGLIGFMIGSELKKSVFQQLGKSIIIIALFESVFAFIVVSAAIYALDPGKLYQALILGSVASATAPAATVYVIQQYKAKGPLTSTILAVVGIDDAFALIIFVFASLFVKGILSAQDISLLATILIPLKEISLSILLGVAAGLLLNFLFRKVRQADDLLLGAVAFILLQLGLAKMIQLSGLLAVMSFGVTLTNTNEGLTHRLSKLVENFSPLLFAYFFIFAGAHLDIYLLPQIGIMGLVYLISRTIGKVSGASLGALVGQAPAVVKKYIGFALIPQVGVALAMAIMVRKEFGGGEYGEPGIAMATLVINILLFTTIITEIVGPLLTKYALLKAGERES